MKKETFIVDKTQKLSVFIRANIFGAGYGFFKRALSNKDIRVNQVRVTTDIVLNPKDEVIIFYNETDISHYTPYDVVLEDKNVLIVNKHQGIETTSDTNKNTLEALLCKTRNVAAVHRLDTNTEGLVIFAKNKATQNELRAAFENGWVDKTYLALCFGELKKSPVTLVGYLRKDSRTATVEIFKEQEHKSDQLVKTRIEFIKKVGEGDFSLIKIKPITGRTHQIRAQLASIKLYIVGDTKYGNTKLNNVFGYNKQCLCASALVFNLPKGSPLEYLNSKKLEVTPSFI